jgi:hypothetical protein
LTRSVTGAVMAAGAGSEDVVCTVEGSLMLGRNSLAIAPLAAPACSSARRVHSCRSGPVGIGGITFRPTPVGSSSMPMI